MSTAKIPFLVLAFFDPHVLEATLESLKPLRHRIDVLIAENPSEYSHLIRKVVAKFAGEGLVSKHFRFDENVTGNAVQAIVRNEIDLDKNRYVFISDGDMISYRAGWLDEIIYVMDRHAEIFAMGANLDRSNIPLATFPESHGWDTARRDDRGDYVEGMMGFQAVCFRGPQLKEAITYLETEKLEFRDGVLLNYCYEVREQRWAITKFTRFRHLTWDTYSDLDHPYTKFKGTKTFEEHWSHRRSSGYSEILALDSQEGSAPSQPWPTPRPIERKNIRKWAIINWLVRLRLSFLLKIIPSLLR